MLASRLCILLGFWVTAKISSAASSYLRIERTIAGPDVCVINLAEITLYYQGVKVNPTGYSASSVSAGWPISRCFDGLSGTFCSTGDGVSCPHYIEIDFDGLDVDQVIVTNRADCCRERIVNDRMTLTVDSVTKTLYTFSSDASEFVIPVSLPTRSPTMVPTIAPTPVPVHYVRITDSTDNGDGTGCQLNLAEIQLFYHGSHVIPVSYLTSSDDSLHPASLCFDGNNQTVCKTSTACPQYLQINLHSVPVDAMVVTNGEDCCLAGIVGSSVSYVFGAAQNTVSDAFQTPSHAFVVPLIQPQEPTALPAVAPSRAPTLNVVGRSCLFAGDFLLPGQCLTSLDSRFNLCFDLDGALKTYDSRNSPNVVLWSNGLRYANPGKFFLHSGGNLQAVAANDTVYWHSNTFADASAFATIQNDGNFVLYNQAMTALWACSYGSGGCPYFNSWQATLANTCGVRVPTRVPTPLPTRVSAPTPRPVNPGRGPVPRPPTASWAPYAAPTRRPSFAPSIIPPSIIPARRAVIVNQFIRLSGVDATSLSTAAQDAVLAAVATVLAVSPQRITLVTYSILGSALQTGSQSLASIGVLVETQLTLDKMEYPAWYTASAIFNVYDTALTNAVQTGLLDTTLRSSSLSEFASSSATSAQSTLVVEEEESSSSSQSNSMVMVIAIVVPVAVVLVALAAYLYFWKIQYDRISATPYADDVLSAPCAPAELRSFELTAPVAQVVHYQTLLPGHVPTVCSAPDEKQLCVVAEEAQAV